MAPDFVPGLRLAREFYATSVRPLLESQFPGLAYAAALLGTMLWVLIAGIWMVVQGPPAVERAEPVPAGERVLA